MSDEIERAVDRLEALLVEPADPGLRPEHPDMAWSAAWEIRDYLEESRGLVIDADAVNAAYLERGGLPAVEAEFGEEIARLMENRVHARRLVPRFPGCATFIHLCDEDL